MVPEVPFVPEEPEVPEDPDVPDIPSNPLVPDVPSPPAAPSKLTVAIPDPLPVMLVTLTVISPFRGL